MVGSPDALVAAWVLEESSPAGRVEVIMVVGASDTGCEEVTASPQSVQLIHSKLLHTPGALETPSIVGSELNMHLIPDLVGSIAKALHDLSSLQMRAQSSNVF